MKSKSERFFKWLEYWHPAVISLAWALALGFIVIDIHLLIDDPFSSMSERWLGLFGINFPDKWGG